MSNDSQPSTSVRYSNIKSDEPAVALKSILGDVLVDLNKKRGPIVNPIIKKSARILKYHHKYPVFQKMKGFLYFLKYSLFTF